MKKFNLLLFLFLLPFVASADAVLVDGFYYILDETGKTASVNQVYNSSVITIPATIIYNGQTYTVTTIDGSAFNNCSSVTTLTIPNTVISIESQALNGTTWYDNQPDGLVYAGKVAYFYKGEMPANSVIDIEDGTTGIADYAFILGGNNLIGVNIPKSVKNIGTGAFAGCTNLTSLIIPDGVKSIKESTCINCKSLISVSIPESVTSIGRDAFQNCQSLLSITIPDGVTSIGNGAFKECQSLGTVVIPDGVTAINDNTFYNCSNLSSVTIPKSVTYIGFQSFIFCNRLSSIYISDLSAWCKIDFIESSRISSAHRMYLNNVEIKDLVIPNDITSIKDFAFYNCTSLETISLPNSITSIGSRSFQNCSNLTSVVIPNSVQSIEEQAFNGCGSLVSLCLSENLKLIKRSTFSGCGSLKDIKIPASVEYVYQEAFAGCSGLKSVRCLAVNPPFLYENSFSNYQIPLYVVTGSRDSYLNQSPWNKFKIIIDGIDTKFTLTYKVDDVVYKTVQYEYDESIIPEPAPTKDGFSFSGWSVIPETMPANDVTVTGKFTINKYKLTYQVDGEDYKTYEVEYGSTITLEAAPTKEGYTFSGWSDIPEAMPANDVTVTGIFTINKYKLIYQVDGEDYKTYEVEYGSAITAEAAPTKEGYTFSGWSEIPETMPAKDVTITGTFTKGTYKLTYTVDGEEYKVFSYEYGAAITAEAAPSKEGYTFSGWSEIPETMPANDVTVTGSFTINKYKLIYQVDGEDYKTYEVKYGSAITAEAAPTKEGYTFSGWSEIPETMPANDVTVTGTFTINKYKLIYQVDGEDYKTYEVEYGSVITAEATPSKEGYTFSGWSEIPEKMPAKDVTITGTFTKGAYKLTYMVDGEEYKVFSYDYGATITAEAAPTKEGYTFSGWNEIPETMPAKDVTITGTFTINKYKLIYQVDGEDYKTYEIEYGSSITPEPAPIKDGYLFLGWSEIPETMPAEDVTVTGSFTLQTTEDVIKITNAGQTTWCSKYDLDFTGIEGIKAYTAGGYDRVSGTIWLMRVNQVPAKEGILIIGTPGDYKVPHKSTGTYYVNMMKGTLQPITINETDGEYTNYYLSNGDSGVGFYKVNGSVDLKANRAYLPLLKGTTRAGTRFIGIGFEDDGTTNLTPALSKGEGDGEWYTLQGQRVAKPGKGLYIRNGKKVVIK